MARTALTGVLRQVTAGGQTGGLAVYKAGMINRMLRRHNGQQLRRKGLSSIMTAKTLAVFTFHVTVYAFFFKPLRELLMLSEPERIIRVLVEDTVIMTIPAWIARKICSRIA